MKKTNLLNAPLSAVIAELGHTDTLVVCDAGLPIPLEPERIDLAIIQGLPRFFDVLDAITSELILEKVTIAKEMAKISPDFHKEFAQKIDALSTVQGKKIEIEEIDHAEFKKQTASSRAIVRTGEVTYYANAILTAGVAF